MGRLSGFRYREVAARMQRLGFTLQRHAKSSHEIWHNSATGKVVVLVNHPGDVPEGTLRSILKQAGIGADDFLAD